ncbi:MAG: TIGR01459 family HAD-type hydrolase [Deltaproteobacteria bacterium]|nr:TIGR01459 family HAD-type hydrolase [Deltaproteobacteria bacterium]
MRYIAGISEIQDCYDAFITDIWGVLHDGTKTYPGVIDSLRSLQDCGKKVLLLSNSGRRAKVVCADLKGFDILPGLYNSLVTSGELTHLALRYDLDGKNLGSHYFLFGSERYGLSDGLMIRRTDDPTAAEFVLTIGVEGNPQSTDIYQKTLELLARRGLTMVCANPDVLVNRNSVLGIGPGALAAHYEKRGGRVIYFGKPFKTIYQYCLQQLPGIAHDRIVTIGDSLRTDIAGARNSGLDSILVGTGLHCQEFATIPPDTRKLKMRCKAEDTFPTMIMGGFIW